MAESPAPAASPVRARRRWRVPRLKLRHCEALLLVLLVYVRIHSLLTRLGDIYGHDANPQMEVTRLLGPGHWRLGLQQCFNCYQPPLGYIIPKLFIAMGLSEPVAAQMASFSASLLAFFFLRGTLRRIGILHTMPGITFLYVTSAIPLQNYLAVSINIDTFVYLWACAILYFAVVAFWVHSPAVEVRERRWLFRHAWRIPGVMYASFRWRSVHPVEDGKPRRALFSRVMLVVLMGSGMFIKYSGLVLCALPALVALAQPRSVRARWGRQVLASAVLAVTALAPATVYYGQRYFAERKEWFVMNHEWQWKDDTRRAREARDKDTFGFVADLLTILPTVLDNPNKVDQQKVRLHDWWRLHWVRPEVLGWSGDTAFSLSKFYLDAAPLLLLYGAWRAFKRRRRETAWMRLGRILLASGVLQLAALLWFVWHYPYASVIPVKAFNTSPMMWTLGWLLAFLFALRNLLPWGVARRWRWSQYAVCVVVGAFVFYNHALAIY